MAENEERNTSKLSVIENNLNNDGKSKIIANTNKVYIKTKFKANLLEYISDQLKDVIFSGWVGEREYVENLEAYRDIIQVDEWELALNKKLKNIMQNVKGVMEGIRWINITVPSSICSCYCLWVLLNDPPFPGHYWMQIQDVQCDSAFGLKISVKIIREISPFDGETRLEREKRQKGNLSVDEWKELALSIADINMRGMWDFVTQNVTPTTISQGIRFIIVLGITLIVAFGTFLQYFSKFSLRFIKELGVFIHNATPFAQSVIRFFEKLLGGLYLLIAMIYRDLRHPTSNQITPPASDEPRFQALRAPPARPPIHYVPSDSWINKE